MESNRRHAFTWELTDLSPFPAPGSYETTIFDSVRAAAEFKPNHPFPFYERWGYVDVEAFLDGLKWGFRRGTGAEANTLIATGVRSQYTVLVPIVDPVDNHLFFNFHPQNPNAMTPVIQIGEDDAIFFGQV